MVNGVPFNMALPRTFEKADKATKALQQLSDDAIENGNSNMTLDEINDEIEAVRLRRLTLL